MHLKVINYELKINRTKKYHVHVKWTNDPKNLSSRLLLSLRVIFIHASAVRTPVNASNWKIAVIITKPCIGGRNLNELFIPTINFYYLQWLLRQIRLLRKKYTSIYTQTNVCVWCLNVINLCRFVGLQSRSYCRCPFHLLQQRILLSLSRLSFLKKWIGKLIH